MIAIDVPWPNNHRFYKENSTNETKSISRKNKEQLQPQKTKEIKNTISKYVKVKKDENIDPWNLSEDTDRIQFQVEGHEGPKTYIFGFDTGNG